MVLGPLTGRLDPEPGSETRSLPHSKCAVEAISSSHAMLQLPSGSCPAGWSGLGQHAEAFAVCMLACGLCWRQRRAQRECMILVSPLPWLASSLPLLLQAQPACRGKLDNVIETFKGPHLAGKDVAEGREALARLLVVGHCVAVGEGAPLHILPRQPHMVACTHKAWIHTSSTLSHGSLHRHFGTGYGMQGRRCPSPHPAPSASHGCLHSIPRPRQPHIGACTAFQSFWRSGSPLLFQASFRDWGFDHVAWLGKKVPLSTSCPVSLTCLPAQRCKVLWQSRSPMPLHNSFWVWASARHRERVPLSTSCPVSLTWLPACTSLRCTPHELQSLECLNGHLGTHHCTAVGPGEILSVRDCGLRLCQL